MISGRKSLFRRASRIKILTSLKAKLEGTTAPENASKTTTNPATSSQEVSSDCSEIRSQNESLQREVRQKDAIIAERLEIETNLLEKIKTLRRNQFSQNLHIYLKLSILIKIICIYSFAIVGIVLGDNLIQVGGAFIEILLIVITPFTASSAYLFHQARKQSLDLEKKLINLVKALIAICLIVSIVFAVGATIVGTTYFVEMKHIKNDLPDSEVQSTAVITDATTSDSVDSQTINEFIQETLLYFGLNDFADKMISLAASVEDNQSAQMRDDSIDNIELDPILEATDHNDVRPDSGVIMEYEYPELAYQENEPGEEIVVTGDPPTIVIVATLEVEATQDIDSDTPVSEVDTAIPIEVDTPVATNTNLPAIGSTSVATNNSTAGVSSTSVATNTSTPSTTPFVNSSTSIPTETYAATSGATLTATFIPSNTPVPSSTWTLTSVPQLCQARITWPAGAWIREFPSVVTQILEGNRYGYIQNGEVIAKTIDLNQSVWYEVTRASGSRNGWIRGDLIELIGDCDSIIIKDFRTVMRDYVPSSTPTMTLLPPSPTATPVPPTVVIVPTEDNGGDNPDPNPQPAATRTPRPQPSPTSVIVIVTRTPAETPISTEITETLSATVDPQPTDLPPVETEEPSPTGEQSEDDDDDENGENNDD